MNSQPIAKNLLAEKAGIFRSPDFRINCGLVFGEKRIPLAIVRFGDMHKGNGLDRHEAICEKLEAVEGTIVLRTAHADDVKLMAAHVNSLGVVIYALGNEARSEANRLVSELRAFGDRAYVVVVSDIESSDVNAQMVALQMGAKMVLAAGEAKVEEKVADQMKMVTRDSGKLGAGFGDGFFGTPLEEEIWLAPVEDAEPARRIGRAGRFGAL